MKLKGSYEALKSYKFISNFHCTDFHFTNLCRQTILMIFFSPQTSHLHSSKLIEKGHANQFSVIPVYYDD